MSKQIFKYLAFILGILFFTACGATKNSKAGGSGEDETSDSCTVVFDADSAFSYVKTQTDFGPRVPGTAAHKDCGLWMAEELKRHGAHVLAQQFEVETFDGVTRMGTNIFGQFNPRQKDRLLLLAHWDTRPWADKDPDPARRKEPVMGANDGASGVGVLLEVARLMKADSIQKGVDILFVDLEDWGDYNNDESWALGAKYFAQNPIYEDYRPQKAILLDMVGGKNAEFRPEFFSSRYASPLLNEVWSAAEKAGFADRFSKKMGGAITDDHLELIKVGIPAIDIIEYQEEGFNPTWHTTSDTIEEIDPASLKAVGQTIIQYITQ